jgi:hypothetical protein
LSPRTRESACGARSIKRVNRMKTFEYEIIRHSPEQFAELAYFCSEQGECTSTRVFADQVKILDSILNERGRQGWELVQVVFAKGGCLAFWKRETEA